jgi:hypothetical protein
VNCSVCGRDFDERGYQLVVPGRAESFDSFECALRAQGLPWLGPSPRPRVDAPPFERAPGASPRRSALSAVAVVPVRTRAALAGAALLAAVTTVSAYAWVRHDGQAGADPGPSPGAVALTAAEALRLLAREQAAGAGQASAEPRRAPEATGRPERRTHRRPGDGGLFVTKPVREQGDDAASARAAVSPTPALPTQGGASAAPAPASPPRRPGPSDPPSPAPPPMSLRPPPPSAPDAGTSRPTRPGWGRGDKNHDHDGPPGLGATSPQAGTKPPVPPPPALSRSAVRRAR